MSPRVFLFFIKKSHFTHKQIAQQTAPLNQIHLCDICTLCSHPLDANVSTSVWLQSSQINTNIRIMLRLDADHDTKHNSSHLSLCVCMRNASSSQQLGRHESHILTLEIDIAHSHTCTGTRVMSCVTSSARCTRTIFSRRPPARQAYSTLSRSSRPIARTGIGTRTSLRFFNLFFTKSKGMLQFAAAKCAPPTLLWGDRELPICTQEKVLGVHITSDGKWVKHLQAQLRAARYKLHQWRPVLSTPRHVLLVKLQALRTYVMPCVQYAMEIITPRAPDELAIVSEMDVFLEKALLLAVGVPEGLDSWRTRRCVKAAVVWHDLGVLRTMSQFELAHLRFDAKRMPDLKQDEAGSMDMADEPTPRRAGLTAHIRASLAPGHAWRASVLRAAQRLRLVPMPESVDTAPRRPAAEAPTNAERTLRARNADAQRSLASVRFGRPAASQLPTQRSARVSARQYTSPDLDMFSLVFQANSDKCPPRALHCEFASEIALPMVALRLGHLLDDYASPCHSLERLRASVSMSRARPGRADAVRAPTSSPVTSRQTRLCSAAQPALAAPRSAASTNAATPQQPASALVAPPVALAEDRCYRCAPDAALPTFRAATACGCAAGCAAVQKQNSKV